MATVLYKDGETILVDPKSVQNHLDAGWSLDNPERPTKEPEASVEAEEVTEDGESDED